MTDQPETPAVADAQPPRARRYWRLGAATLVSVALAVGVLSWIAVSEQPTPVRVADPPAAAHPNRPACPPAPHAGFRLSQANYPTERIPDDFVAVSAVLCAEEIRTTRGGGTYSVLAQKQATTGVDRLTRELRKSNQPPPPAKGAMCRALGDHVPWFVLTDASGTVIQPQVPIDSCQRSQPEAMQALRDAGWTVVQEQRLRTVETDQAHQAGCSQQYGDMFAGAGTATAQGAGPALTESAESLRVCVYAKASPGAEVGEFTLGGMIADAAAPRVLRRLDGAPLAEPCANRSRSFLTVQSIGRKTSSPVSIELDGCLRMIRENQQIVQLTAAQLATVTAALPR